MKEMDASADYFLYNHVELVVKYHELGPDSNRVVGFYVQVRKWVGGLKMEWLVGVARVAPPRGGAFLYWWKMCVAF